MANHSMMKLGRLKPTAEQKKKALPLKKYLCRDLPSAPAELDNTPGATYRMYGNDRYGDCTCAALANFFSTVAAREGTSLSFTDQEVIDFYFKLGDGKDQGLVESQVLDYAKDSGFPLDGSNKLKAWVSIDPKDHELVKSCMMLFWCLYMGAELPITAESQEVWDVAHEALQGNSAPGSWGGHAMALPKYDKFQFIYFVTWGGLKKATWAWWDAYVDECYVLLDLARARLHGVDVDALLKDMQVAGGQCIDPGNDNPDGPGPQPGGPLECPQCHVRLNEYNYADPSEDGTPAPQTDPHAQYLGDFKAGADGVFNVAPTDADWAADDAAETAGNAPPIDIRCVEKCPNCTFATDRDGADWIWHPQDQPHVGEPFDPASVQPMTEPPAPIMVPAPEGMATAEGGFAKPDARGEQLQAALERAEKHPEVQAVEEQASKAMAEARHVFDDPSSTPELKERAQELAREAFATELKVTGEAVSEEMKAAAGGEPADPVK